MSVALTLRFVEIFRQFGIPVTFEPGWELRGNGLTSAYEGGIEHHTGIAGAGYNNPAPGTRVLRDGRSDLPGPLCNFQGCFDGRVHVIAAHPANHAGASGGPSMGPLPRTNLFNPRVMGLEMDYPGSTPMSPELYRIALVFAVAVKVVYGSVERCRAHAETSIEGKWDPGWAPGRTIDMAELRAASANLEDDVTLTVQQDAWLVQIRNQVDELSRILASGTKRDAKYNADLGYVLKNVTDAVSKVGAEVTQVGDRVSRLETAGVPVTVDYDRLANAVVDLMNKQARDGDPTTGPVS